MLKKKMQALAKENLLSTQNKFEVISDPSASQVLGGIIGECTALQSCGRFSGGGCDVLKSCSIYNAGG